MILFRNNQKIHYLNLFALFFFSDVDPYPLDPFYRRLPGSGSVWRDTGPDPGHINVQNSAMAKEFCVDKLINVLTFFTKQA